MTPLYTQEQFCQANYKEKLPLECYHCKNSFLKLKNEINKTMKNSKRVACKYCSQECAYMAKNKRIQIKCAQCNKETSKSPRDLKKSINLFCSQSCAATYNNAHKKHGTKRSKLETWLEEQLYNLYPQLETHFNRKDAINSELDIYIPSLKLAFELNGIFHYEPIYGIEQFESIKNNDNRKFQACLENNIEFCIIDISSQKNFKSNCQKSVKFLGIITNLINDKLKTLNIDLSKLPIIEKVIEKSEKKIKEKINRRDKWASSTELEVMIKHQSLRQISKKFNVSWKTIEKWIKTYGIINPRKSFKNTNI